MKKILSLILVLASVICFCSCAKEETSITDISSYDTVWTLSDRKASSYSFLFPTSITANDVLLFSCEHKKSFSGAEWQVVLELKYESDALELETDKIKSLCKGSAVFGESEFFSLPVYASVWNTNGCYEYAIFNSEQSTITYVYLQNKEKTDITLDSGAVPVEYALKMESASFSIY